MPSTTMLNRYGGQIVMFLTRRMIKGHTPLPLTVIVETKAGVVLRS